MATSPMTVVFKKPPPNDQQGTLKTEDGILQDFSTLTRFKDFSLYEDEENIVVYGFIIMKEFKVSHICLCWTLCYTFLITKVT